MYKDIWFLLYVYMYIYRHKYTYIGLYMVLIVCICVYIYIYTNIYTNIPIKVSENDNFKCQPHFFEIFKCPYEHIPCVESGHTAI